MPLEKISNAKNGREEKRKERERELHNISVLTLWVVTLWRSNDLS